MAYTVKQLARISGASVRTLHFYDELRLLKPAYQAPNGYRIYDEPQLLMLQQILAMSRLFPTASAFASIGIILVLLPRDAAPQASGSRTQVVLLGTGEPWPGAWPVRSCDCDCCEWRTDLVDFGPGVVRRAAAAQQIGMAALNPINLRHAFLTHLHSDHTLGYPDLIFTPWVVGRKERLEARPARKAMTMRHLIKRVG